MAREVLDPIKTKIPWRRSTEKELKRKKNDKKETKRNQKNKHLMFLFTWSSLVGDGDFLFLDGVISASIFFSAGFCGAQD